MTDPLKTLGVYTLTVEASDQFKNINDGDMLMYCITNTETGVREMEDAFFFQADNMIKQLNDIWTDSMNPSLISVPGKELKLPTHVTPRNTQ